MLTLLLTSILSFGAADSLQEFVDPQLQLKLQAPDPQWVFLNGDQVPRKNTDDDLLLRFIARGLPNAQGVQPSLTLRVDPGVWKSAKHYAEKWLKEYPKFGYELQFSRDNHIGALEGFEMELSSTVSPRRVRQFIVQRTKEMWVFTCSSSNDGFSSAWTACEKILKTAKLN